MKDQISSGKLSTVNCIMLLIGAMIGSAIFSLSGLTIFSAGPAAILAWLIAGAIMLLYGLCMGELACRYPKSGGVYYFPRLAFGGKTGHWLGWLSCWSCLLTNIVAIAFSAIYTGIYLNVAFSWAAGLQLPIAIGSILFCLLLNLLKIELAGKINIILVIFLLLLMGTYICCAFFGGTYSVELLSPFFTQGTGGIFGFAEAVPVALIGYSGIMALAFMANDVHDPRKTLPVSMLTAILFVAGIYSLMILSTLGLVNSAFLQKNPGMRFIPMFCACSTKLANIPWLAGAVSIAAVLALMTTMNICIAINTRAMQAAGEDGSLPSCFGRLNARGIPVFAAVVTCVLAIGYACFPQYTMQIVNFGAVFNIITMVLTMLALIKSRKELSQSPFTVPGGKILPYILLLILLICNGAGLFHQGRNMWLYTVIFLLTGVIIKYVSRK